MEGHRHSDKRVSSFKVNTQDTQYYGTLVIS